jgi:hypothetical protein
MNLFLYGVIFACSLTSTVLFFRFWRETRDRLFLYFAQCFALLGVERLTLAFLASDKEYSVYLIRLVAFVLLIIAVVHKNRNRR